MRAFAGLAFLALASMASSTPLLSIPFTSQLLNGSSSLARISSAYPLYFIPGIRVSPNYSFSIGLLPGTFTSPQTSLSCRASVTTGTWLTFDNNTLTFDGVAPSSPQSLNVTVSCSDLTSTVSDWFLIQVGKHALELQNLPVPVTGMVGNPFRYDASYIMDGVAIDGKLVDPAKRSIEIAVSTRNQDWIQWDSSTSLLTGAVPTKLSSTSNAFPVITLTDKYNDTLEVLLPLDIRPSSFSQNPLPSLYLDPSQPLRFDLRPYLAPNISVSTSIQEPASEHLGNWLFFDPSTFILSGQPNYTGPLPNPLQYSIKSLFSTQTLATVTFTAVEPITNFTSTATLDILGKPSNFLQGRAATRDPGVFVALISVSSALIVLAALVMGMWGASVILKVRRRERYETFDKSDVNMDTAARPVALPPASLPAFDQPNIQAEPLENAESSKSVPRPIDNEASIRLVDGPFSRLASPPRAQEPYQPSINGSFSRASGFSKYESPAKLSNSVSPGKAKARIFRVVNRSPSNDSSLKSVVARRHPLMRLTSSHSSIPRPKSREALDDVTAIINSYSGRRGNSRAADSSSTVDTAKADWQQMMGQPTRQEKVVEEEEEWDGSPPPRPTGFDSGSDGSPEVSRNLSGLHSLLSSNLNRHMYPSQDDGDLFAPQHSTPKRRWADFSSDLSLHVPEGLEVDREPSPAMSSSDIDSSQVQLVGDSSGDTSVPRVGGRREGRPTVGDVTSRNGSGHSGNLTRSLGTSYSQGRLPQGRSFYHSTPGSSFRRPPEMEDSVEFFPDPQWDFSLRLLDQTRDPTSQSGLARGPSRDRLGPTASSSRRLYPPRDDSNKWEY